MTNSSPGWAKGKIPTAAEWQNAFESKVDASGGELADPAITGGTATGITIDSTSTLAAAAVETAARQFRVPATLRAPGRDDDTSRGYKVGDFWLDHTGRMWQAQQVTPFGVWTPYATPRCPLDGFSPAPAWASGTVRLKSSYTGSLIRIQRASDNATLDVGYGADNRINQVAADDFCAGTYGVIVREYDQMGSGLYTTNSMTNGPRWDTSKPRVGQVPGASYQSIKITVSGGPVAVDHYSTLPAGLAWNPADCTVLLAGVLNNPGTRTDEHGLFSNSAGTYGISQSYNNGQGPHGVGFGGTLDTHLPTSPHVAVFTIGSSFFRLYCNGEYESTSHPNTTTSTTGGYIGYDATNKGARMQLGAFILWTSQLSTSSTPPTIIPAVEAAFGIQRQFDDIVAVIGASDTSGTGSSTGSNWPLEVMPLLRPATRLFNLGSHGIDTATVLTYKLEFLGRTYEKCRGASARNFVVVFTPVGNDLGSLTLAQIKANYQEYVAYAKGLGSNVRVVFMTKTTRCSWAGNTSLLADLTAFNAWIRNSYNVAIADGGVGGDGFADLAANPLINNEAAATPVMCTAAVSADGTHLTSAYQLTVVGLFEAAINAELGGP